MSTDSWTQSFDAVGRSVSKVEDVASYKRTGDLRSSTHEAKSLSWDCP